MNIYIHGTGCVSAQETAQQAAFPVTVRPYQGARIQTADPDYKQWIDLKMIRRMSHAVKMGIAAAKLSLEQAGIEKPDAVITGTAYGCLDDTGVFLTKLVNQQEEMLTPTAFIQSTHNTVAGQIALLLSCHGYNNTFVHKGFSFESALNDSMMILREGHLQTILAGAMDELTDHSFNILSRFNLYKKEPVTPEALLHSQSRGTIAGEGATCFVLGTQQGNSRVKLMGLSTIYRPDSPAELATDVMAFLAAHNCAPEHVDLLITGRNGDANGDAWYAQIEQQLFNNKSIACFKHLSGEYPTVAAFGMWMGARSIAGEQLPVHVMFNGAAPVSPQRVLIYNHHQQTHHSLILLHAC